MREINGKAIYSPKGKAGEYAKYAVNFYVGCSNDCDYCYCKRGVLGSVMGAPVARLKKCFKDKEDAFSTFSRELQAHLKEFREHGLFFTFTSDPFLPETIELTIMAVNCCVDFGVPVKLLTKRGDIVGKLPWYFFTKEYYRNYVAFGFTLTGHDELERGASTNKERINCMRKLHKLGFKTFASIEPVITLKESYDMVNFTLDCCDLYKIGLMSGKREYTREQVRIWTSYVDGIITNYIHPKVYWKDSVLEFIGETREHWDSDCDWHVGSDYNIFKNS